MHELALCFGASREQRTSMHMMMCLAPRCAPALALKPPLLLASRCCLLAVPGTARGRVRTHHAAAYSSCHGGRQLHRVCVRCPTPVHRLFALTERYATCSYGATGAGKTFTVIGTMENRGITLRALRDLVDSVEAEQVPFHAACWRFSG